MTKGTHSSLRQGFSFSVIMVGILAVLVPLLALLQYRWIGQVSEAEREHLQLNLDRSNQFFVFDVQREFGRIPREFSRRLRSGDTLDAQVSESYSEWLVNSNQPRLIRNVYVVDWVQETGSRWRRLDLESGTLSETASPVEFEQLPRWLDTRDNTPTLKFYRGSHDDIWFVIPRIGFNWVLVELDSEVLWSELVPTLVAAHFDDADYNVILLDPFTQSVLYRSEPELSPANIEEPDSSSWFFQRVDPQVRRSPGRGSPDIDGRPLIQVRQPGPFRRSESFDVVGAGFQLLAQHRAGSLESAVTQIRRRNLGVGFGILALLAATGAMIIVWAERVRAVGRLQMEFAAGISHELRTPLATIRTAAHNIAAGIVSQPEQIREYAGIVQTEGRRLSAMVDQVIQFAKTEAGRRSYDLKPTEVGQVIERAAALEGAEGRIQTRIEPGLPPALADETALTHCVGNLLVNALKFGADGEPIQVEARYDIDTERIQIRVENGGPGIDAADLPHLFEPFYRGRNVGHVPGSGLGLSLVQRMVERQKGRVTVESEEGQGAVFTLHIPAAKSQPDAAAVEAPSEG